MSEHDEQCAFIRWFRHAYPKKLIAAFANDGKRTPRQGAWMKDQGLLPGMPDILIASQNSGYPALFIEMKYGRNKLTESQESIKKQLESEGYLVKVCYSWQEAKVEVECYFENT
jgi:hypothetical protein